MLLRMTARSGVSEIFWIACFNEAGAMLLRMTTLPLRRPASVPQLQ